MRQLKGEQAEWAYNHFGHTQVGDSRRTARLLCMATRAAEAPAGKVSEVFGEDRERPGAYDLLEGGHVDPAALSLALGEVAAEQAANEPFVFVAIDGSCLTLADRVGGKDFGSVGNLQQGNRGLKVINALGISPEGVPPRLFAQAWWARVQARTQSAKEKRIRNIKRNAEDKETRYWLEAIEAASVRANQTKAALWFQLDREADNRDILLKLAGTGHRFTVRSSWNRLLAATGSDKQYLRQWLNRKAAGGNYTLDVAAGPGRKARQARMVVRWDRVVLCLRKKGSKLKQCLEVSAVWAREEGTCPAGEKPLDWLLFTNVVVDTFEGARHVIYGYTQRWKVEELHKTWKSGACNVEGTQLRSQQAVRVWATILAAVAVRIERLKALSRTDPERPASIEFTSHELRALILLKRQTKKRNERVPDTMPTIGQATLWVAQLGGYTGKSSGGPPGSITIRRGLDRLLPAVRLLQALEAEGRRDQC